MAKPEGSPKHETTQSRLPRYYTKLEPFRNRLTGSTGILTYHHVGPRPRAVRLKGLYVSPKLFEQQIRELKREGFVGPAYSELRKASEANARRIFISFDDGYQDVFENALPLLKRYHFKAIQFLVAEFLGQTSEWQTSSGEIPGKLMDKQTVKAWLEAGNEIGSHTLRHPFLTRLSLSEAREEVTASKKKLEDLFGIPIQHFCYPYGDWNEALRDLVQQADYRTACTTQFGINTRQSDPYTLRRLTARYRSRSLRAVRNWIRGLLSKTS